jgi:aspartate kinase
MSIIVQKYGGSSVATPEKLKQVAARIVATRRLGHRVVVVVSAMGNTTNELLALARSVSPNPQRRELDMLITTGERISMALLSMAIQDQGYPAVSFTGSQSGIITTDNHTNARIVRITPFRIHQALDQDRIVIVAGFQGVSERREITSLGRGGSDTTAVALAAALGAEYAEICSDVDGVYSADPAGGAGGATPRRDRVRRDAGARRRGGQGAQRRGRRVGAAREHRDPLRRHRRGRQRRHAGPRGRAGLSHPRVVAITAHPGLFVLEPETPGAPAPADLESTLAAHGAAESELFMHPGGWGALVPKQNVHGLVAFREAVANLGNVRVREDLTLVTVVGRALAAPPGLARAAASTLTEHGIALRGQIIDAGRAAFLVDADRSNEAVRVLHARLIAMASP